MVLPWGGSGSLRAPARRKRRAGYLRGDRGPLAGQVLIFDVELLGVSAGAQAQ